jgi:Flp pilus assembly pilin Flp
MSPVFALYRDQKGAAAIHYAAVVSVIGLAVLIATIGLGLSLDGLYQSIGDRTDGALLHGG